MQKVKLIIQILCIGYLAGATCGWIQSSRESNIKAMERSIHYAPTPKPARECQ